jgi:plastocyanin domain-containing protein
MIAGKQVIKIGAKAGYAPRITLAKAGVPSLIKFETNSTFDCSASLAIPDLNYKTILPPTGVTELDVPEQEAGTVLRGLCSMGMYSFEIRFS